MTDNRSQVELAKAIYTAWALDMAHDVVPFDELATVTRDAFMRAAEAAKCALLPRPPMPSHTMAELSQAEALDMLEKLRPVRPDRFFLDCDDMGRWSIKGWKDKDEAKREIARLNATI